ncbi:hypothetical protein ACFPRL_00930 [Pseudoclavibacter helvolus]
MSPPRSSPSPSSCTSCGSEFPERLGSSDFDIRPDRPTLERAVRFSASQQHVLEEPYVERGDLERHTGVRQEAPR